MNDRRDHYPNYSFEFARDGNVLSAMFWADEREKAYYNEFGDVISFDATFRTNKYQMIFVPFTAIDHHKKSVTVGAGRKYTKVLGSVHIQVLVWKMDGSYTTFNTITKNLNSKIITRFK
ncbi:hypothetical protein L2E82_11103 [Cichorium intybus]|uniref:Uncharacterized protein n=1 Tax=Cichorium intybus TaxID=13427 RepID=A0ACB9GCA4_CICIN|nr:hypothetical protein L2E82_11103 [Cichorium intybus]